MSKIYLSHVLGAPSPTVVIYLENSIEKVEWSQVALDSCRFLKEMNIEFSKMAIISYDKNNEYKFKFIQIKKSNKKIEFESNANCGNSMIAAARVIYMASEKQYENGIYLENIDTKLKVLVIKNGEYFDLKITSLLGKNVNEFQVFDGSQNLTIKESFGEFKFSLLDVVNPYILLDAKELGIKTHKDILHLEEFGSAFLDKVKKIRNDIITQYNFSPTSEFPKVAVILKDNDISARTIYLNKWHSGLPITAAITIATAIKMKNAIISDEKLENIEIQTPKGNKKINIKTNDKNIICDCELTQIKSLGNIEEF